MLEARLKGYDMTVKSSWPRARGVQRGSVGGKMLGMLLALVMVTVGIVGVDQPAPAAALDGSEFDPGYIISDTLFYDGNSMTAEEIQSFLDSKIGTCLNSRCLNVAVVPIADKPADYSARTGNLVCAAMPGGNLPVSELIYRAQVACGISAKVILVTLQKEQGLVTKNSPTDWALTHAMGMGCPDSAPCSDAYAGLAQQIYSGTNQLKTYKAGRFARQPGVQYVQYHPNTACGGTTLDVRNYATAALYNYTPYQPNAAALANIGRTGDSCSSYGNRNFWAYYTNWFGKTTEIYPVGVTVTRIGGDTRYDVAVGVSEAYFAPGVPVVYIASGENFPDAIGAGPAASHSGGPVLLVPKGSLPPSVAAEILRLTPAQIIVVGGPSSVSDTVLTQLAAYAPSVERIGGMDRYEVSLSLASTVFDGGSTVAYLATGNDFPDALSSGAAAGSRHAPVILINGKLDTLDDATWAVLDSLGVTQVYIAGGPASVSPGIVDSLTARLGTASVKRFGGKDRFAVAAAVNRDAFSTTDTFFISSGFVFPDALSATPAAVAGGAPLYVTNTTCVDRDFVQHMIDAGATKLVIVGGPGSVSSSAAAFKNC